MNSKIFNSVIGICIFLFALVALDQFVVPYLSHKEYNDFLPVTSIYQGRQTPSAVWAGIPFHRDPLTEKKFYHSFHQEIKKSVQVSSNDKQMIISEDIRLKADGSLVNRAHITTDQLFRRKVATNTPKRIGILYLGCSYMFGENINDEETLPYLMSLKIKEINHVNLALPGIGLASIVGGVKNHDKSLLHLRNKFDLMRRFHELPYDEVILVYYFISDHLKRAYCSQRCLSSEEKFLHHQPVYDVAANGDLIFKGNNLEIASTPLNIILSKSNLINRAGLQFPSPLRNENLLRHHRFLEVLHEAYNKKFKVLDSYTIYNPLDLDDSLGQIEQLRYHNKFRPIVINSHELLQHYPASALLTLYDGHPTGLMNAIMAQSLVWILENDHPEIFKSN